jgi:hypothetical protein
MRALRGVHDGDLEVTDAVDFHGMVNGRVVLHDGAHWDHHGMINGDLVVEPGARANVHGMLNGVLINRGGDVKVYGTVERIANESGAQTWVDPDARVRKP